MNLNGQDSKGSTDGRSPLDATPQAEDDISNAFRQISQLQLDQYRSLIPANDDAAVDIVGSVLGLDNSRKDTRQHLHWSMSARALNFAIERKFSNTKSGILFNIVQTLLQSIRQGDSKDSCELLIRNCLVPLTKAHPEPDAPHFSAVDVKAVAEFLVDHIVQFFNLFKFVLREERAQDNTHVANIVEIPFSLPLDTAFTGECSVFNENPQLGGMLTARTCCTLHTHGLSLAEDAWNERLQQKAADEQQAQEAAEAKAQAEAQAAEEARLEKEKADVLYKKKQELARKPERLEEAVEKLIKWRIENEKQKLRDQYTQEVNALKGELQSLMAQDVKGSKAGKAK